jgi:hypothetical protein
MKITDIIEESKQSKEPSKPRNFVAKNAINTGAGAHKDKKKAEKQGDIKHKKQAIPMDEGRKDHGYDDFGFSLAPGHDEGEPVYNPRYDRTGQYDRKSKYSQDYDYNTSKPLGQSSQQRKGFVFYNVNDPMTAKKLGLKQTKSGKWYLSVDDTYNRKVADKVFGSGKVWYPKEGVAETATAGATSAGNVAVGAVYKNKPGKTAKNKDGTAKNALDMNANLLTGGSIKR